MLPAPDAAARLARLPRLALFAAAAAVVVAGLRRAIGSDPRELAASLQDDSLYYLLPAFRAWQHGGRWTFDGENPTYGVQPAYAALLTAIAGFCPDRTTLLVAAYALSFLLFAAAAIALARACAGPNHRGPLAGAALLANLPLLYGSTTLKENALATLLLAWWLLWLRRAAAGAAPAALPLGVCSGLLLATRLTPSTMLLLGVAALLMARGAAGVAWGRRALAGLGLGLGPFLAYGLWLSGRWLPTSGSVKLWPLEQALADGSYWQELPRYLAAVPGYLLACAAYATGLPHDYFHVPQTPPPATIAGWLLLPLTLAGAAALLRRHHGTAAMPPGLLLLAAAALLGEASNPVLLGPFGNLEYSQWYVAALPVLGAAVAGAASAWLPPRAAAGTAIALALFAGAQASLAIAPSPAFRADPDSWTRQMLVATERMNELLPSGARVAAANAGSLGYFSRHDLTVINCDGLANDAVFDALRAGQPLRDYLDQARVSHVCDVFAPQGWHGHPLRDLEPLEVVPFHGPQYDGYLLAARQPRPFPDHWPVAGPRQADAASGWRTVPWHDGDPLAAPPGAASPLITLPSGRRGVYASLWTAAASRAGADQPVFYPGGRAARFRSHVGGSQGTLTLHGDGRTLATVATSASWRAIDLDVHGIARLAVHFAPAEPTGTGPLWLAGITWTAAAAATDPPAQAAGQPFGHGCGRGGLQAPELHLVGWAGREAPISVQVVGAPHTTGLLWLCGRADPLRLDPADRRDPCFVWVDRTTVVATAPFATDAAGRAAIAVPLPTAFPAGNAWLQALVGTDPSRAGLSNGLRLDVPTR